MIEILTLASSSRGNAHLITDGVTPVLLDCGINFAELKKRSGFGISSIAGCMATHEHKDHSKAVADLLKAGIDVYMSLGTAAILNFSGHRVKIVKAKEQFTLGTWTVLPFEVEHDAAEPLGFLLANRAGDKLLYATDTYFVRYRFQGLTHLLIECNYADDILQHNVESGAVPGAMKHRLLKSHFSLANVKKFLLANDLSRVEEIHLIHLSDGNSDADRFKREIQELTGKPVIVAEA